MSKIKSTVHSFQGPRSMGAMAMDAADVTQYQALTAMGINFTPAMVGQMAAAFAMDDQQGGVTAANMTPVQFLQAWMPGFVRTITAARKIDDLIGVTTIGKWSDEEIVQGMLEQVGNASPYGDFTNVPLSSWNTTFERRTVVRFEKGLKIGALEEARTAEMRVSSAAEKRAAAALALEIQRNIVGFFGYNNGAGRTYGFLNDPSLPAYYTVANGASASPTWASKQFLEITADIRQAVAKLQTQSQDTINPEDTPTTLAVPTNCYQYLTLTSSFGNSVIQWVKTTYPKMRIVSAPQLNTANGGANVFYLYAESVEDGSSDGGRVWEQLVPTRFITLGVEKQAKAYLEDFSAAFAGVMLKRPYGVVRGSGI